MNSIPVLILSVIMTVFWGGLVMVTMILFSSGIGSVPFGREYALGWMGSQILLFGRWVVKQ